MFRNGDITDVMISTTANAITNLEPGFSDTLTKDGITIALPNVPDTNMNEQKINCAMSLAAQAWRKESGLAMGDLFKSKMLKMSILVHEKIQR